jgi:hypothetical protein
VHEALVKSVHLIEQTQNEQGGWRYNPVPYDADVSVTICQIMGLRSARNAGIEVSKQTIDRAVEYVRRCQNPDGGFKYQLESGASGWPRSAAGVASLYYAGIYSDDAIDRGIAYLQREALPGQSAAVQGPLLLRPLLLRAGHVPGRGRVLGQVVARDPRGADLIPAHRRKLGGSQRWIHLCDRR